MRDFCAKENIFMIKEGYGQNTKVFGYKYDFVREEGRFV